VTRIQIIDAAMSIVQWNCPCVRIKRSFRSILFERVVHQLCQPRAGERDDLVEGLISLSGDHQRWKLDPPGHQRWKLDPPGMVVWLATALAYCQRAQCEVLHMG
jgi:hypothetical protein